MSNRTETLFLCNFISLVSELFRSFILNIGPRVVHIFIARVDSLIVISDCPLLYIVCIR